MAHSVHQR